MPEKIESQPKSERVDPKPRKRESENTSAEQEAMLVLAATQFKALGDPTRLRIINFLSSIELATMSGSDSEVAASETGRTVGDVSAGVFGKTKVSSTLSHHLKELRNAGLIAMKRRGKNLICRLQLDSIDSLRSYLPDTLIIPVTTKAQNVLPKTEIATTTAEIATPTAEVETPKSEIAAPKNKRTGANKSATAPPALRTRVRKSAAVRKNKRAEGGTPLEAATQLEDLGGV